MKRFLLCILLTAAALCAASPAPRKPKLVVTIIIDQFRYDYLLRFRDGYNSGLARLLDHGAVFTDAHYPHAHLVTAVGHSTFLSGATPSISGIIANEWWDRESNQSVTSVFDPKTKMVGGIPGVKGSSPHRLLVSTIADELKMADSSSRVIGVSIKDRSAILPAGHMADAAYWYDNDSNNWVTSDYYRPQLPEWAMALNANKAYQQFIGKSWFPFDAKDESGKPFCTMVAGGDARWCGGIEATPWGNEMIEAFAEAALVGEDLGRHAGTDLLAVSFSSNDYVGHAVGPDDPAVRDISIRTDRLLGKLLALADERAGAGNVLVVLSADHGVAPAPEVNRARKMPGARLSEFALNAAVTDALTKRFGPGKWLLPGQPSMIYLNLELIAKLKADRAEVERVAADAARTQPHIARAYTHHDLAAGAVQQDAIGRAMTLGFYAPRSADLLIVQEPYALFESAPGSSHGTPYDYDTHVPLIFMGPQVTPGVYSGRVLVNDVAPTLAQILGVETPSGSVGRVLTEILP
jgi:predicted AlkP superfamily pyrophosphatase or phosphodiesterase